jgi:hypothetical protein
MLSNYFIGFKNICLCVLKYLNSPSPAHPSLGSDRGKIMIGWGHCRLASPSAYLVPARCMRTGGLQVVKTILNVSITSSVSLLILCELTTVNAMSFVVLGAG